MNENRSKGEVRLKRRMGLFSAVNVILAVMIGSGIFVSPSSALKYSGSVGMTIVVWISCGLVSCLGKKKLQSTKRLKGFLKFITHYTLIVRSYGVCRARDTSPALWC